MFGKISADLWGEPLEQEKSRSVEIYPDFKLAGSLSGVPNGFYPDS